MFLGVEAHHNEKFNVPSHLNFLEVTTVGKNARRFPDCPDPHTKRICNLFGREPGATRHWVHFSQNFGPYKPRTQTEMFVASEPFKRCHLLPPSSAPRQSEGPNAPTVLHAAASTRAMPVLFFKVEAESRSCQC
jgi:hypothetical protein